MYYRRDGTPYPDVSAWAIDFEYMDRQVGRTILKDGTIISTVYLGLDHSFGLGEPLIFETMVHIDQWVDQIRYSTEAEAKAGHEKIVKKWRKKIAIRQFIKCVVFWICAFIILAVIVIK